MRKRPFILGAVLGALGGLVWGLFLLEDSSFWSRPLGGIVISALVGAIVGLSISILLPARSQNDKESDKVPKND